MPSSVSSIQILPGKSLYTKAVLIDTGPLLALANSKDIHHLEALDCLQAIAKDRLPIFISIPTIYETQKRILFDLGQQASRKFLLYVFDGSLNIERTSLADDLEARNLTERYSSLLLTLTDAVNMAIMLRLSIGKAFSFDRHFNQAGYIRIPPY